MKFIIPEEEKEPEVINSKGLIAIPGGKGPGGIENWLQDLEVGTCFLARQAEGPNVPPKNFILDQYEILFRRGNCTRLYSELNGQRFWADTLRFSRTFSLVEVLGVVKNELDDDRSNRPAGLADDAHVTKSNKGRTRRS